MYEAVIQSQEKTIFEAHQRYLYSLHAAETGGYDKGLEEGLEKGIEKGIEKGRTDLLVSQICKKLSRGLTIDRIAKELEEDPEHISRIYDIALKYAPDYNPESVLKELNL